MATRSTIAVIRDDGTIRSVYCHFDGYLEGVGETLNNSYNSRKLAEQIVAHGSIKSLEKEIEQTVFFNDEGEPRHQFFTNFDEYIENCKYKEFNYIFMKGKWFVSEGDEIRNGHFRLNALK